MLPGSFSSGRAGEPAARPPHLVTKAPEQHGMSSTFWKPREKRQLGGWLAFAGGTFLAVGLLIAWQNVAMLVNGVQTTAEIVHVEYRETRDTGRHGGTTVTYRPTLRYVDQRGRVRKSKPSVADGRPLSVGEKLSIYYDPDDLSAKVLRADAVSMYVFPGIMLVLGMGGLFGGLLIVRRAKGSSCERNAGKRAAWS